MIPTTAALNVPGSDWLVPKPHDYRKFTYAAAGASDDDDVTIIEYYKGGAPASGGILVATLTLAYYVGTNNVKTMALTLP